jgi:2-keto-4-pentenoate hydratase/2-oxohepta-3-ene-1,7-dioic acid hydratase in catechol pathway
MVHDTPRRVEDLASVMTLEPGDVIATGAPAGTAFGRTPLA